jgi:DNA repair exonuclease SbcCD nuclease subunit
VSDQHFGSNSHSKGRFESQMAFFEQQFFPYLLENKVKDVLSLGDIVHNRNVVDLYILQELKQRFFAWFEEHKIRLHLLQGNHDTYFKNSVSHNFYVENLNEFGYSIPYVDTKVVTLGKYTIGMVPWVIEEDNLTLPEKCDIICMHADIQGMPLQNGIYSKDGLPVSTFNNYRYVFSGHFHKKSEKNNIRYVGTQYQLTWNDFDEVKGFYVLGDDYDLEFIENDINPRFIKVYYNDSEGKVNLRASGIKPGKMQKITQKNLVELAQSHYIKLFCEKCVSQLSFDQLYSSLAAVSKNDYKIEIINTEEVIEDYNLESFEQSINSDESTIDVILQSIAGMVFTEDVDKDLLLSLSKDLYAEAQNEYFEGNY